VPVSPAWKLVEFGVLMNSSCFVADQVFDTSRVIWIYPVEFGVFGLFSYLARNGFVRWDIFPVK
jgi:hypothetical protein